MGYPIQVNLILGLAQEPYDGGVGVYLGVIGHSTANDGDSADGERSYESRTWQSAFVHFFVDDQKIEQVADTKFVAFGAGHTGNHSGYVQVELCQTTDPAKFAKAYAKYTWLLAKILFDRKLGVKDGITLMSHKQVSDKWHETTHQDPIDYLARFGKTWADVVRDVTLEYQKMDVPAQVYRIRKTWADPKSQIGAFSNLDSAKAMSDQNPGYQVFDGDGHVVYAGKPMPSVTPTPSPAPAPVAAPVVVTNPAPFKGTEIIGRSEITANQMNQYMRKHNANAPLLAHYYVEMEDIYDIRADIAFLQMCKETKFQEFGGQVKPEQHNPAGLGATDDGATGATFDTWAHGIEAQFQHLFAYATKEDLPKRPVYDQRLKYVQRGASEFVKYLGIQENPAHVGWASDPKYGYAILDMLKEAAAMPDEEIIDPPVIQTVTVTKEVQVQVKMPKLVLYSTEEDAPAAKLLSSFLACPAMALANVPKEITDAVAQIYVVGGKIKPVDSAILISGTAMYDTAFLVLQGIKNGGKW